jgi:BirA family biotin operon repressor/biotin-[acetyl-CoA-carboxylase] ligase
MNNIKVFLENNLTTSIIGKHVVYYKSVSSTMEIARKLAKDGAAEGTVVIADNQTSGRGRSGKTWLSPDGNLAISIILHPSLENLSKLIMTSSLAVVNSVKMMTGIEANIKWPNDIIIRGKKVCGILIENEIKGNMVNFSIVGIGINIDLNPLEFPEISAVATSLSHESSKEISKAELICVVLSELERQYLLFQSGIDVYNEWYKHIETIGKVITVKSGETFIKGKAETITENGNLILRDLDGRVSEIISGEVTIFKQ